MAKLSKNLNPDEFRQYYFLKEELKDFCRQEGLKVSGSKQDLENRIIHYLGTGEKLIEPPVKQVYNKVESEINLNSILGENFRCSEDKREFFKKEIGSTFKFNVRFQKWLKTNPDKTYRDAIDAYFEIQNSNEKTEIGKQFQYNQYIRDFFKDNGDRSLEDAIVCWKYKKSLKGNNRYEKSDLEALS
ncbi:MAG: SAP domain-containing protein [Methanobrevibacter sp.]|nr:SAP domain-containing protein [Methanobrevibacter sp.]